LLIHRRDLDFPLQIPGKVSAMSQTNGFWGSLRSVLVIFVVGAGLGFVWRQGWVPLELLPARTGTLDPAHAHDPDDPAVELSAPVAEQASIPAGQVARTEPALTDLDREIFAQQREPEITDESPPKDPPQRLPATHAAALEPASQPRPGTPAIQAAAYSEPAGNTASETRPEFVSTEGTAVDAITQPDLSAGSLATLIQQADEKLQAGEVLAAHRILSEAYWKRRSDRPELVERLDRTAATIFFQPQPHFVDPYLIEPGDRLEQVAEHYKVTWEYLSKLNRVDPKRIQAGRRLKVVRGPFSAVVELEDYSITVHLQGYYVRRFPVGVGRDRSSPIGRFAVLNKVVNPQYTDPDGRVVAGDDPANPLGERWIDLGSSFGIHGTIEPNSIGQAASRGCIRLNDKDIVNVYDFLSVGSEVVIRH